MYRILLIAFKKNVDVFNLSFDIMKKNVAAMLGCSGKVYIGAEGLLEG